MRRYRVVTFGCQMNAHDSERIKGMLEEIGLGEAPPEADADVLVFNTCTIREKPDQRLAAHLAQAKALKHGDPDRVIAVGGCYAEAQRERIFDLFPFVDVAFGPGSIAHLGEWLGAGGVGVHYNASKAGMEGLTRGYAARLVKDGVTVNAVAPSLIETDMLTGWADEAAKRISMGRLGAPEEVAQAVLLVLGNAYMTGQTVVLNGGMSFI